MLAVAKPAQSLGAAGFGLHDKTWIIAQEGHADQLMAKYTRRFRQMPGVKRDR